MKMIVNGADGFEAVLDALADAKTARRIVEAGSAAAVELLKQRTEQYHHVVTGELKASFAPGKYHEDLNACWQDVYPQGYDSRGVPNIIKGYKINKGYGRKTAHAGDKFITGDQKTLEAAVSAAMRAEAERIKNETMR